MLSNTDCFPAKNARAKMTSDNSKRGQPCQFNAAVAKRYVEFWLKMRKSVVNSFSISFLLAYDLVFYYSPADAASPHLQRFTSRSSHSHLTARRIQDIVVSIFVRDSAFSDTSLRESFLLVDSRCIRCQSLHHILICPDTAPVQDNSDFVHWYNLQRHREKL